MVIRADARAMGAVTALSFTNRRKPRTRVAATDCKVTRADGSVYTIAARSSTRSKPQQSQRRVVVVKEAPMTYAERLRLFGSTGLQYD